MRGRHFLILVTILATIFLTPVPASAHTGGPPNERLICSPRDDWSTDGYVRACFEVSGDDFWVYDANEDGASAVIMFGTRESGQRGQCRNAHGFGKWHECKFDMIEGETVAWDHWTYDADTETWIRRSFGYYTYA